MIRSLHAWVRSSILICLAKNLPTRGPSPSPWLQPPAGANATTDRARPRLASSSANAAPHGVADEVRGADTQLIQETFDRVGGMLEGDRLVSGIGGPVVMAWQSWCDHLVASDKISEDRMPDPPCGGEAMQ